jgi:capsular exopolysaccharide synthesis family protein
VTAFRRRLPIVVACTVAAAAVATGLSVTARKEYTATTSLLFTTGQLAQQVAGLPTASVATSQQAIQDTDVDLAQIGDMSAKTARSVGHGLTAQKVQSAISVSPRSDTNIINIAAVSPVPTLAAAVANTYSRIFVSEQQVAGHQYYVSALNAVEAQLAKFSASARAAPQGLALQERAQTLATLAAIPSGAVQLVAAARVPLSPSSPRVSRNVLVGALLGLLIGVGMLILMERYDQRIRDPEELQDIYGVPLLGIIPESRTIARGQLRGVLNGAVASAAEFEAFNFLRAHLRYFEVDRPIRTLVVASAMSDDGKSTVALNLSVAAANMGGRVLLLEADLRRPTLAEACGVPRGPGLADVVIGAVGVGDALRVVDVGRADAAPLSAHGQLTVLVAGAVTPPNPAELLESAAMERFLKQVAQRFDFVVIDTPPLGAVSDAFALLRVVDGVIVVNRIAYGRRDSAFRLRQTLEAAGAPLLGVVANGVRQGRGPAYGYDYGYAPTPVVAAHR